MTLSGALLATAKGMQLCGAMLPRDPAGPVLADTQALAQHPDRLTTAGRAHQFPLDAWSATIRFKRAFSCSRSRRRLASSGFIPRCWSRQR
jgi:hypothetical protein